MKYDDQLRSLLPRAREVMSGLSDDQINWRPAEGSWSVAECVVHLNTTNSLYISALEEKFRLARREDWKSRPSEARVGLLESWFIRSLEPPYRWKFKAPKEFAPPASHYERDELLARWVSQHQRLLDLSSENDDLDWRQIRVPSPAMPRIAFGALSVFGIIAAHDRRHLWQAMQIRSRLPTSATR